MTTIETWRAVRAGTWPQRLVARIALLLAVLLLRLPLRWAVRAARCARWAGRRPLDADQAAELVEMVRWAGRRWPVRIACLETSLGAVLAAALCGRRLSWCLGARLATPVEYHAWVAGPSGEPLGEYIGDGWHYRPALTI